MLADAPDIDAKAIAETLYNVQTFEEFKRKTDNLNLRSFTADTWGDVLNEEFGEGSNILHNLFDLVSECSADDQVVAFTLFFNRMMLKARNPDIQKALRKVNRNGQSPKSLATSLILPDRVSFILKDFDFQAETGLFTVPNDTFNDYFGREEIKDAFSQVISNKPQAPRNFLLTGPPGLGKTMLAKCLAGQLGRKLIIVKSTDVFDKHQNVGAEKLLRLLRLAKEEKAVLLFDEFETIARSVGESVDAPEAQSYAQAREVLNEFFQYRLDEIEQGVKPSESVVSIAITNFPEVLDQAIRSRFNSEISIHQTLDVNFHRGILKAKAERFFPVIPGFMNDQSWDDIAREACSLSITPRDVTKLLTQVNSKLTDEIKRVVKSLTDSNEMSSCLTALDKILSCTGANEVERNLEVISSRLGSLKVGSLHLFCLGAFRTNLSDFARKTPISLERAAIQVFTVDDQVQHEGLTIRAFLARKKKRFSPQHVYKQVSGPTHIPEAVLSGSDETAVILAKDTACMTGLYALDVAKSSDKYTHHQVFLRCAEGDADTVLAAGNTILILASAPIHVSTDEVDIDPVYFTVPDKMHKASVAEILTRRMLSVPETGVYLKRRQAFKVDTGAKIFIKFHDRRGFARGDDAYAILNLGTAGGSVTPRDTWDFTVYERVPPATILNRGDCFIDVKDPPNSQSLHKMDQGRVRMFETDAATTLGVAVASYGIPFVDVKRVFRPCHDAEHLPAQADEAARVVTRYNDAFYTGSWVKANAGELLKDDRHRIFVECAELDDHVAAGRPALIFDEENLLPAQDRWMTSFSGVIPGEDFEQAPPIFLQSFEKFIVDDLVGGTTMTVKDLLALNLRGSSGDRPCYKLETSGRLNAASQTEIIVHFKQSPYYYSGQLARKLTMGSARSGIRTYDSTAMSVYQEVNDATTLSLRDVLILRISVSLTPTNMSIIHPVEVQVSKRMTLAEDVITLGYPFYGPQSVYRLVRSDEMILNGRKFIARIQGTWVKGDWVKENFSFFQRALSKELFVSCSSLHEIVEIGSPGLLYTSEDGPSTTNEWIARMPAFLAPLEDLQSSQPISLRSFSNDFEQLVVEDRRDMNFKVADFLTVRMRINVSGNLYVKQRAAFTLGSQTQYVVRFADREHYYTGTFARDLMGITSSTITPEQRIYEIYSKVNTNYNLSPGDTLLRQKTSNDVLLVPEPNECPVVSWHRIGDEGGPNFTDLIKVNGVLRTLVVWLDDEKVVNGLSLGFSNGATYTYVRQYDDVVADDWVRRSASQPGRLVCARTDPEDRDASDAPPTSPDAGLHADGDQDDIPSAQRPAACADGSSAPFARFISSQHAAVNPQPEAPPPVPTPSPPCIPLAEPLSQRTSKADNDSLFPGFRRDRKRRDVTLPSLHRATKPAVAVPALAEPTLDDLLTCTIDDEADDEENEEDAAEPEEDTAIATAAAPEKVTDANTVTFNLRKRHERLAPPVLAMLQEGIYARCENIGTASDNAPGSRKPKGLPDR
ncbi:hypothetical protein HDU96_004463, partial [Phlyctochytrium bullatum]